MDELRAMVLWCPDWPVVAAEIVDGIPATGAVAVLHGNRVVACSETARADGVRRGLRRREAQGRCPDLVLVDHDPGRDARAFEPVVAAVEQVAVGVEVVRSGVCAWAARGPARYFGGEERAAERIVEQVAEACAVESQVGVADGVFAAGLAARQGRVVVPGRTPQFLAGVAVEALERPALTDLLRRLGVGTLGDFAALPAGDVLTRFGSDGALAHRLAGGGDRRPLAVRPAPPDVDVAGTYDEPLERVDVAAFAGRVLAEQLHERLAAHGLACTRLGIEAVTADGQELHRVWRHDGLLTAAAIAERVRWQLDGWLSGTGRAGVRPTAGLVRLRLVPDGVVVHLGLQPGLWGDTGTGRERAHRALSRIQGLLGPEAVVTAVLGGGRSAADQVRLVPWGDEPVPGRPGPPEAVESLPEGMESPAEVWLDDVPVGTPADTNPAGPGSAGRKVPLLRIVPPEPEAAEADDRPTEGPPTLVLVHGGAHPGPHREDHPGPHRGDRSGPSAGQGGPGGRRPTPPTAVAVRRRGAVVRREGPPPWPGRLPWPAPALVLPHPLPAVVRDAQGAAVQVSARLELSGAPAVLHVDSTQPVGITGWVGPWPVDERWWAPGEARRRARFQVVLADDRAVLLFLAAGQWAVEAIYD